MRFERRAARLALGAAGCALAAVAGAQDARIEQIPPAAPPREVPIAAPDARPPAQLSTGRRGDTPSQLSREADAREAVTQLSGEPRSTAPTPQVSRGGRSAQASAPLSSPGESRPGTVVRVGGRDRCDAAATRSPTAPAATRRPTDCARVIETRAGEFARANPLTLSAEQRLLIDQGMRDLPATAEGAVRRIGRNEMDPDTEAAQGIASVVLPPATPATPTDPKTPLSGDAEVLSVIQALAGGTPVTPTTR